MSENAFGLRYAMSGEDIAHEWQAIIAQQASMLETVLYQVRDAVARVPLQTDPPQPHTAWVRQVVDEALHILGKRAHHHVAMERQIETIRKWFEPPLRMPPEAIRRLSVMERVNGVLHENLAVARRQLESIVQEQR